MKLLWLGYLVYSFGNCAIKLCIETDIRISNSPTKQITLMYEPPARYPQSTRHVHSLFFIL